jgi:hypothetical protein
VEDLLLPEKEDPPIAEEEDFMESASPRRIKTKYGVSLICRNRRLRWQWVPKLVESEYNGNIL